MNRAKLFSVLVASILLIACVAGMLVMGTSAADETVQWTVDGTTYSTIKEALTAAEGKTWAASQSLVITVDPSFLASESVSHDAGGTAYAGGIAFGQKTIFRADKTRLPITIKGSSVRTAFTLNITKDTKVACANSYTFENLTFPIGDTSDATYFYAGSGIVRLENVATGSGVLGNLGGDSFTARVFDGWTAENVAANAYTGGTNTYSSPKVLTSFILGNDVSYVNDVVKSQCNSAAVLDSGGWDTYGGVSLTPADTVAEFALDGGTAGTFRARWGDNPVAESISRVESGTLATPASESWFIACGKEINNSLPYAGRTIYPGNVTVIFNSGSINRAVRLLHTVEIQGNYKIYFNGGTFANYIQVGYQENVICGDYELNVTGGTFNDTSWGFALHPSARVEGNSTVNISGGTFKGTIQGLHMDVYDTNGEITPIKSHNVNILPNAESSSKDPVFDAAFYAVKNAATSGVETLNLNISAGTFNKGFAPTNGIPVKNLVTNIRGGIFNVTFFGGDSSTAGGKIDSITHNIYGGTFNGRVRLVSGSESTEIPSVEINIYDGVFADYVYGTYKAPVKTMQLSISGGTFAGPVTNSHTMSVGTVINAISGGTFNGEFYGGKVTNAGVIGSITNNITGGTFNAGFYGGGQHNTKTAIPVTTHVSGGVFNGDFYGGGEQSACYLSKINTTVSGGTFNGAYYGASFNNVSTTVTNTITGGTFKGIVMGGGKANVTGNITNNISGGIFSAPVMGVGVTSSVTGSVTNNITGGTFAKPVYGGSCTGIISGTVTNNLSGPAKFNNGFCGMQGTYNTGSSVAAIVNYVFADAKGDAPIFLSPPEGTFTYNSVTYDYSYTSGFAFLAGSTYGGGTDGDGNTYKAIVGTITTTVEAGEFGTSTIGMYKGGCRNATIGKDENGVSIYNYIKGGTFNFRWYAGCLNGTAYGETRNVIEGGVFMKEFVGGNRTMNSYDKLITTTIKGGDFRHNVYGTYLGYTADQAARGQVSSTVTLNIEGGSFQGDIYGLGNLGAATTNFPTGSGITETGAVLVNVYGGTFYGTISPTNQNPNADNMKGTAQVTVEPKCDVVLLLGKSAPRFDAEKFVLKGSTYDLQVNGEGSFKATSAEGAIDLVQIDKWKNANYLTLPAGNAATVNVSTASDAYGYYEIVRGEGGEAIEVNGVALKLGASLVLTDRIAVKFQLSKTAVDAVENFTYSFALPDGTVLAEGTKADLGEMIEITEFEYYTLTLKALGIGQFDTPITVNIKGVWENDTFSIYSLAKAAVTAWAGQENFVTMAKAIVNMSDAANDREVSYTLTPDAVVYEKKTPTKDADAAVNFTQKSLLMDSAVGIRLIGTVQTAADAEGLKVFFDGHHVTGLADITLDGTTLNVDLFFSAFGMGKEFKLEILDKNGKNCLTMFERLDSFAAHYGSDHALAKALLSYIQATSTMKKASFSCQASETERAYLDGLYAGETAYYGDLHAHPGGGIIEDGRVDMSIWVSDRETIGADFYTAMNHKQVAHMYDDGWDPTVLIGGSEPATTITKNGKKISVHYNMIVPNPEALIEVLQLFPEFKYTGGTGDIAINMGTFGYPGFTYDRFNELVSAIKERGGTVVNVHPKQQHTSDDPLDYYYQDYMGLEVFYSYSDKNIHGKDSQDNYNLWCDLLALGKRVWATSGSDSHSSPVDTGFATLYSAKRHNTSYVEKIVSGNFAPGYVGIRMAIGDTEMGGHTDFEGKKLIFSVGDVHEKYLSQTRAYRVNVITDQGVVFSTVIDGTKTSYFSLDADENAAFYRIEVVDDDISGLPIVGLGNPIWND